MCNCSDFDSPKIFKKVSRQQLADALTGKTKAQMVGALLTGDFHPAVIIDWSKV